MPITIHTADGHQAAADRLPPNGPVELRLDTGEVARVPADMLTRNDDGTYALPLRRDDLRESPDNESAKKLDAPAETIPVVEEQLRVRTESVESGRVVVHVVPSVEQKVIGVPLTDEHVEVRRVPASRFVDRPEPPREVDGVTIVPVYEEVLVCEKRLRVKEELHIHRTRTVRHERHRVALRHEEAQVLRSPENPTASPHPDAAEKNA